MVTNVTSLLKTVKAVEDEATRGTRALEATIEYIKQELTVRAPSRPEPLLPRSFGSRLMRHGLSCKSWLQQGQRYLCLLFPGKQESLFSLFFFLLYYLPGSFPPCFPVSPSRVLAALIRVWGEGAGRVRKARGPRRLAFCNLMLILIRGFTWSCSQTHINTVCIYLILMLPLSIAVFHIAYFH